MHSSSSSSSSSSSAEPILATTRVQIVVRGIVQGVRFRPFVFSLAARRALKGRVRNNAIGVLIDVEGDARVSVNRERILFRRLRQPERGHDSLIRDYPDGCPVRQTRANCDDGRELRRRAVQRGHRDAIGVMQRRARGVFLAPLQVVPGESHRDRVGEPHGRIIPLVVAAALLQIAPDAALRRAAL